jgi:TonB family protein
MKANRIASLVVAASLTAMASHAQTAAEQMQKGIYTQETAGDLDGAIAIYRQIVNSGNSPRDLAAEAQYRLAQSLLQKGDLSNAAQEFEKLARSYADYGGLVSSLASTARVYTPNSITIPVHVGRGGVPLADANLTPEQQADRAKKLAAAMAEMLRREREELQKAGALPSGGGRSGAPPADAALTTPPPGTVRVGSAVEAANLISQTAPVYPPLAKAARVQGTVRFDATIGTDGRVENLQLISGPPLLVQAATDSVRQWVYQPVMLNGQPVTVISTVNVNFTLAE